MAMTPGLHFLLPPREQGKEQIAATHSKFRVHQPRNAQVSAIATKRTCPESLSPTGHPGSHLVEAERGSWTRVRGSTPARSRRWRLAVVARLPGRPTGARDLRLLPSRMATLDYRHLRDLEYANTRSALHRLVERALCLYQKRRLRLPPGTDVFDVRSRGSSPPRRRLRLMQVGGEAILRR